MSAHFHTPPPAAPFGALIMAYGTPAAPEELEAYYTHIRHGKPPTPELLAELRGRYQAIGGLSPLLRHTQDQVAGIQTALDTLAPGRFQCLIGMKHARPFLEESAAALAESGVQQIIGLVLAPHYSSRSVGEYMQRAQTTIGERIPFTAVQSWHLAPGYLSYLKEQVLSVRERLCHETGLLEEQVEVIFTAHSLPARILITGDPYPQQLRETAEAVARETMLEHWSIGWQSAGRTDESWIGPDILDILPTLVARGVAGVVVCPAGFVSDHLEVLYDLDIEARQFAQKLHLAFARTALPGNDPRFCATLARVLLAHATQNVR
jgi:ferrochelatase